MALLYQYIVLNSISIVSLLERKEQFHDIVDVRTPDEFLIDHIPGSINLPVLSSEERAVVGTLYKKDSFEGKKLGASLISKNIASHLKEFFKDKDRSHRPVVYCQRGGERSKSLATVLSRIGMKPLVIDGGYKAYRRHIVRSIDELVSKVSFRVLCGLTGCGKTKILKHLSSLGCQVINLEELASHCGSLLGANPNVTQPSQTLFESKIFFSLEKITPEKIVYVESESKKIGDRHIPNSIISNMRNSHCVWIESSMENRVELLLKDYNFFTKDVSKLQEIMKKFSSYIGKKEYATINDALTNEKWESFVTALLKNHYDPLYEKSINKNFPLIRESKRVKLEQFGNDADIYYSTAEFINKTLG